MLHFSKVSKYHGGHILFQDATFQANPGERVGLVGPNGAGKSTIFRIITGEVGINEGQVGLPSRTSVGYFSQDVGDMSGRTVLEEALEGAGQGTLLHELAALEARLSEPLDEDEMARVLEEYGDARERFEESGGYDTEIRAQAILTGLGIPPEEHGLPVETFSGGWKMRVALARILVQNPDLLLMDEPTNHLDLESIMWLEEWLRRYPGTLVMTSHDREFLNRAVTKIVEIANGQVTVYNGNYDFYERERDLRAEQLAAAFDRQQDMLAKEENFIARFKARASHAAQVQSRVKKLDKIERVELPEEMRAVRFDFPAAPRSGEDVLRLDDVGKVWTTPDGRQKRVLSHVAGMVKRLNKVAVVGVNGAGKSTLLKMVAGHTEPTEGKVTLGASLEMGYFAQSSLDLLDPNKTVLEQVSEALVHLNVNQVRTLLGCFLFTGDDVHKQIRILSGGEKSRVVLAMILGKPRNFLILDEPTNHLDIRSREILLDALVEFQGTLLLVSHDRHFLRTVTNRTFKIGDGKMQIFEGGFADYVQSSQGDLRAS